MTAEDAAPPNAPTPGERGRQSTAQTSTDQSNPLAHIASMTIDYRSGLATILGTDGRSLTAPVHAPNASDLVTSSTFTPGESRMDVQAAGASFTMRIGTFGEPVVQPVVYLDQNHWIDFARWQKEPTMVVGSKRPFFEALDVAAREQRVIVPLASAHLTETAKRGGSSRLELASTMLRVSSGWQMRSVLALRRAELRALFGTSAPLSRPEVITLDPSVILDKPPDSGSLGTELGPELAVLVRRQVWAITLVGLLMDAVPDEDTVKDVLTKWSQSFTPLAQHMRGNS